MSDLDADLDAAAAYQRGLREKREARARFWLFVRRALIFAIALVAIWQACVAASSLLGAILASTLISFVAIVFLAPDFVESVVAGTLRLISSAASVIGAFLIKAVPIVIAIWALGYLFGLGFNAAR